MAVITISREYGSRGNEFARLVCDRLGCRYFDKDLMAQLGAQIGLEPDQIADLPEDKSATRGAMWSDSSLSCRRRPAILQAGALRPEPELKRTWSICRFRSSRV